MDYKGYKEKYENNIRCQIKIYQMDCKELLKQTPDKYYSLCIVDPPYGIKQSAFRKESANKATLTKNYNNAVYGQKAPNIEYFKELFRVSQNQIIWGGNYYNSFLPSGRKWIFWDKGTEQTKWGDGELAFTSFHGSITKFKFDWNGMIQGDMKNKEERIHPTQKPVALYKWLLEHYAKKGDKILDTHLGSMSSVIACFEMGYDITGSELDADYYKAGIERVNKHTSQLRFDDFIEERI